MRELVEALCSDQCGGRAPGTAGGRLARRHVSEAFARAGVATEPQLVPGCDGANLLATIPGDAPGWVLVGAHLDHLGTIGGRIYRGADDNAAAVAILVDVARALAASRPRGRGVLVAIFDGEEPPHFLSPAMGSEHFALHPTVPLEEIDLMICLDLVGHALGHEGMPRAVRETVFALGAERAELADAVDGLVEEGVVVRRADLETVPPLSDYWAFQRRSRPVLFLTCGRWRHYHTPEDTPDKLDFGKMAALARWLERAIREACARPGRRGYDPSRRDDASTLRSVAAITAAIPDERARAGRALAEHLLTLCREGRLPEDARPTLAQLVGGLEDGLG